MALFLLFLACLLACLGSFISRQFNWGNVSRVAPIDKLSVVITMLLAFLFLHEQPSFKVILGALLIAAGSIFMIYKVLPLNVWTLFVVL